MTIGAVILIGILAGWALWKDRDITREPKEGAMRKGRSGN